MNNKTFLKWFSLFLLMITAGVGSAFAQTLSMADFYIEAGETKTVALELVQNNVRTKAFQCTFNLPAGLTMAKPKAEKTMWNEDEEENVKPSVAFNDANNSIAVYHGEGLLFNADAKDVLKVTFTADATFQGGTITISGISISDAGNNGYFPADVKVKVTSNYTPPTPTSYAISVAAVQHGSVSVDKSEAAEGETVQVTATPAAGYELDAISVKSGNNVIALSSNNTFTMPAAAVVVSATFKKIEVVPTGKPTLSMADFYIEAGGTKTVTLELIQNNVRTKAFQCKFNLPAGLTMAKPKAEKTMYSEDEEENVKPSVAFNEEDNSVAVYHGEGLLFNADAKDVLKVTFTADATFQGGTIIISGISISDQNNNGYDSQNINVKVTSNYVAPTTFAVNIAAVQNGTVRVDKSEAAAGETVQVTATPAAGYELEAISVKSGNNVIALSSNNTFTMPAAAVVVSATFKKIEVVPTGKPTLSMADFYIEAGGTKTVTLELIQNNVRTKAFQCRFNLPAGLTMAKPKAEKTMYSEDEEENVRPSVAFNEEDNSVAVYHGEGLLFNADAKDVLKVTFTADATFQGGTIIISGISISDQNNNGYDSQNINVKVTSNYVAPTTYAVNIAAVQNGTVRVDKSEAAAGETVQVTATPAAGYELEAISVKSGNNVIALSSNNTFTMPAAAVVVSASFKKIEVVPTGKPTLSMADFTIEAGASKEVTLELVQNGTRVKAFQCQFNLPAGLTMAKPKAEKTMWNEEDEENVKPSVAFNEDFNQLAVYHGEGLLFNADAKAILKVTFTADATFQGGTITISDISISDQNNNGFDPENIQVKVTCDNVGPQPTEKPTISMADFTIEAGASKEVTLELMQNGYSIKAFQCNFNLPAGLTMAKPKAEKVMWNEEEEENVKPSVAYNEETNSLAVYHGEGLLFNADAKDVLKITFTADVTFQGGTITISDISISDENNNGYDSENIQVKVTSSYVAPTTYAVNIAAVQHGTVRVDKSEAAEGETVKVTATPAAGYELGAITVKSGNNVIALSADNTFTMPAADVIVSATFKKIEVGPQPTDKPTLSMADFILGAGETKTVSLELVQNGFRTKAFQCRFQLPAGLTMAKPKAEKTMWSEDDEENVKPSVAFNEEDNSVAVYHGEGLLFNADATAVLKITFTADASFQGGTITISGISISDQDNNGYDSEDVKVLVTSTYDGPTHDFTYQEYLLYNVGAGMYLGASNNWGTQASFVEHPEYVRLVPQDESNVYHLESQVNNGGDQYYLGDNGYMDTNTPVNLVITQLQNGNYTIANVYGECFGFDGFNTILVSNIDPNSVDAQWTIVSLEDAKANLAAATAEEPMDATFLIKDANFGRNNRDLDYWIMDAANQNLSGGDVKNYCAESWHSTFTLSQEITDIPAGLYALTAQGFYRQDGGDNVNLPVFYANDATATFPLQAGTENSMYDASVSFSEGLYTINPIYVKVAEGETLTIGARLEENIALWCIWDNFVLTYLGADAEIPDGPEPEDLIIDRTEEILAVNDDTEFGSITLGHTEEYGTHQYGALVTEGNGTVSATDFWFYSDPNIEWQRRGYADRNSAAFINNVEMSAENVASNLWIPDGKWTFLSFPYDVKVKDIMPEDEATQWVIRKYDGQLRADGEMDKTWANMNADDVLHAYEGYIWQSAYRVGWSGFVVPAIDNANKNNIFAKDDVAVSLSEYKSEFAHNRSWNLVGNPYPSYFNLRYMDFSAPVTTWNVNTQSYEAYSPLDDNYIFYPYEAFFVQRPEFGSDVILFDKNGRQTTLEVGEANNAPAFDRTQEVERIVLNLTLSDGAYSDRTRIVLNETANYDYELDKDASKFMSPNSLAPQFYTIGNDVPYAINERPLSDGIVPLSGTLPKAGQFTIALHTDNAEIEMTVVDRATGVKVRLDRTDYTFDAEAGSLAERFVLYVKKPTGIRGIDDTQSGEDATIYSVDGRRVQNMNARGIYIVKKGSQVVKTRVQ